LDIHSLILDYSSNTLRKIRDTSTQLESMIDFLSSGESTIEVESPQKLGVFRVNSDVTEVDESFAIVV